MNDEQPAVDPQQNLDRPARKQVPGPVMNDKAQAPGSVNIWSGKKLGPRGPKGERERGKQVASAYRCRPKLDVGKTKGSQGNINTFCTFFAKGMCYQGPDCPYLHRLPTSADNAAAERSMQDIFGREKMPLGLERKKGGGSYETDMTTLYVHYGGAGGYAVPQLRHMLLRDFGEFGPIRTIHIVPTKTIAFIKFHWRVSAEFAREAMDQQQLMGSTLHEVLAVRWAYDDQNPIAVIGRKRAALDAAESAAMAAWDALPPEEKRARIAMAQQAHAQRVSAVAAAMPQPLLAASEAAGGVVHQQDDSFDAWRGFGSSTSRGAGGGQQQQEQHVQGAVQVSEQQAQEQQQQQQAWGVAGEAGWPNHQQQQYQQQQHQQQGGQAGDASGSAPAWFQGWRQRHKPETYDAAGAGAGGAGGGGGGNEPAAAESKDAGGGLGLLAGYGSDSDSDGA